MELKEIIHAKTSLTKILRSYAKKSFHVEVLFEGFVRIQPSDQLGYLAKVGQLCWHRQVKLWVDEVCWVVGKSWIPLTSLRGRAKQLFYLKNRPLGDILFRDPHLKRSEFIFGADGRTRSSVFHFYGEPLVVREIFCFFM